MDEQVQLQVSGKLDSLSLISQFLVNNLQKFGMGDHDLFQTQIAVDEAITNIIEHGELAEQNKIIIKCKKEGNKILIIIEDKGKPFDPTKLADPDITAPIHERKTGGLGVYFIKKYMNQVEYDYRDGKNILTMIKNL
ncbi:MAG: ATP-binding protein [Methanobacterium sp.]|nr:ATP-binding protein [Methanobacterium sp.]